MVGSGTPEKMKMSTTELRTSGQRGRNDCTIPGCLLHPLTLALYVSPSRVGEEDQLITALALATGLSKLHEAKRYTSKARQCKRGEHAVGQCWARLYFSRTTEALVSRYFVHES